MKFEYMNGSYQQKLKSKFDSSSLLSSTYIENDVKKVNK